MKYQKNEIIGKMRDRLVIQNVVRSKSATGFVSETWNDDLTVWSKVDTKINHSNENIIDSKNTAKNTCEFLIRNTSLITEDSRIVWNDKLYQVKNIQLSHDRRFITFTGVFFDSYDVKDEALVIVNASLVSSATLQSLLSATRFVNTSLTASASLLAGFGNIVNPEASLSANGSVITALQKVKLLELISNATANVFGDVTKVIFIQSSLSASASLASQAKLTKLPSASLTANASVSSVLDVITQGVVTVDATLNGNSFAEGELKLTKTFESSLNANASLVSDVQLPILASASMSASASLTSEIKVTKVIILAATANATTGANAQLTRIALASMSAAAQSEATAKIFKTLTLSATASASTEIEATIGISLVSSSTATATTTSATLARSTFAQSSPSASATVSSATLTVQYIDPNFNNVSLLLHGNGSNGSTTFTDNSSNNLGVSVSGNAQIDTTIKKFGTGSMEFDGTGDFLTLADSELFNFGSTDFTVELWVYPNSLARQMLIYQGNSTGQNNSISITIEISATSKVRCFVCSGENFYSVESTSNIVISTWTAIAFVRNGNTGTLYVNGSSVSTVSLTGVTINNSTNSLYIGSGNTFLPFNGYIDELRITKGVARYTANYTVATREFPNQ